LRAILLREADPENSSALDEYDRFLLQVVSILRTAPPREEAIAYLVKVESEHMGTGWDPLRASELLKWLRRLALI
jgi:hypothetical protein